MLTEKNIGPVEQPYIGLGQSRNPVIRPAGVHASHPALYLARRFARPIRQLLLFRTHACHRPRQVIQDAHLPRNNGVGLTAPKSNIISPASATFTVAHFIENIRIIYYNIYTKWKRLRLKYAKPYIRLGMTI